MLGLWPIKHNHITHWKGEDNDINGRNINEHSEERESYHSNIIARFCKIN